MKTFFASPERSGMETIQEKSKVVRASEILTKTLDSLSHVVAILNPDRQAVFINKALLSSLGFDSAGSALGSRPGEILNCIHATEMDAGCGTSINCRFCGAGLSIVESQLKSAPITRECRITATLNGELISFDLSITSSPLDIQGDIFTLFVANDISDEKRRHAMERIFFHDVINKAGSLDGLLEMLAESEEITEIKATLKTLHTVSSDLVEEILSQRDLVQAEKGEISIRPELMDPARLILEIAAQMRVHPVARSRQIETSIACDALPVSTDKVLLNRILTNMMKNALEATGPNGKITVTLSEDVENLIFSVHNESVMSDEVKSQIFQRSFSTKGMDRGLGTYSMKLLGEKYLRGRVSFTSENFEGTLFYIEIPKQIED